MTAKKVKATITEDQAHELRIKGKHIIAKYAKSGAPRNGSFQVIGVYDSKEEAMAVFSQFSLAKKASHKYFGPLVKISMKGFVHDTRLSYPGAHKDIGSRYL